VTAFKSLASWRGDGPFGAWLTRIAIRIAIRKAGRRRPIAWIDPVSPELGSAADADAPATDRAVRVSLSANAMAATASHDPSVIAVRGEREAAIRAAVARLEEPYREVVALRFFGELSLAEISLSSGRPIGTVKTHLHRGLQRLRRSLDESGAVR
jgi:RNA polymerase sigma-70 factor, ECF subfamily